MLAEVAEPDPDRCHAGGSPAGEVALVVPGRGGAVLTERAEGPPGGVALLVRPGVERGRPPLLPRLRRLRIWPDGSAMVALMRRRRRQERIAQLE